MQKRIPGFIGQVIAESSGMLAILATVKKIAPANASVLIQGETGTGKGLVAKLIHRERVEPPRESRRLF